MKTKLRIITYTYGLRPFEVEPIGLWRLWPPAWKKARAMTRLLNYLAYSEKRSDGPFSAL